MPVTTPVELHYSAPYGNGVRRRARNNIFPYSHSRLINASRAGITPVAFAAETMQGDKNSGGGVVTGTVDKLSKQIPLDIPQSTSITNKISSLLDFTGMSKTKKLLVFGGGFLVVIIIIAVSTGYLGGKRKYKKSGNGSSKASKRSRVIKIT